MPLLPEALARLEPGELLVNEMYTSIQGESSLAGWPCFFIRLAGCHLRCNYCDTAHAFHEGTPATVASCVARARESGVRLVEVTGGEPLLQKSAPALLRGLAEAGLRVLLETGGALPVTGLDERVTRIVDVKCPGSGMAGRNLPGIERTLRPADELKLVISDRADYEWARRWLSARRGSLPAGIPVHFSPVHGRCRPEDLASWIIEDRLDVRLNLQLHKFIWDPRRRGV